jgi:adenosine deaminase
MKWAQLMTVVTCNCFHQMAEYRISIYGRKKSEWDQMASWIVNNELYSENVVWLIQVGAPPPPLESKCVY